MPDGPTLKACTHLSFASSEWAAPEGSGEDAAEDAADDVAEVGGLVTGLAAWTSLSSLVLGLEGWGLPFFR